MRAHRFERAAAFLTETGAGDIPHLYGDLRSHLEGVAHLLRSWGADEDLQLAGLCHATYGTDGFGERLLSLEDRPRLRDVIGARAEALVHLYAASDRDVTWAAVGVETPLPYRDRFTGERRALAPVEARAYLELTFANELEILIASPAFLEEHRVFFDGFLPRGRAWVTDAAFAAYRACFSDPPAST